MNGTGFGSTRPEIFQQQHRLRSMSWCEGGEALSTTINKHKCEDTVMKQDETTTSSLGLIRSDSSESPSTEIINLKKPSARKNAWGCLSYADLIAKAIESSPNQRLTLNQIYSWMVENVPYFRAKGQTNSSAGWKNSIRHNLSLHGRFVRVQNEGAGKSSWWMVNNNNRMQKTPRRRSTTMDSKTFEKKKKINTFSKDCFSLESSSLSASVPAYIGSCSQYQPQQTYPQFLHHQQTHIRPLDSFESAFRPIDRQECIKFSKKDHSFSLKNTTALGYDDNCYNTCDVKNENPHEVRVENSCSSNGPNNNQILFCSLQNVIPSIIRQPVTCQNFGESEFNVTAGLPPQIPDRGLPDFFKLPDEAWRQYLPPSPNGLTEAVISSESLTALLESGADSEIVDLVPPSLSSFDESSHDHKKTLVGKELCMLTSASNDLSDLTSNLPGDNQQETSYGHKQLNSLLDSSLISTPINQERELMNYSTSLINQALNTDNYESNKSEKCFDQNCTPINLFSIKTSPKFISTLALQSSHLPMDSYSIQGKNHVLHDCQSLCSKEKELEVEFESKNSSFTLPYNMPSILETSTPLATTAITSTVPSHENTESVSSTLKS